MKQALRMKSGIVSAAVLFLLLLFCPEEAWAGDGFSGGEYKASYINQETSAENLQFTGNTKIILDEDMNVGSIKCDGDLEIENQGAVPHTFTLHWHDTALHVSGDLTVTGINLKIAQEYDGTQHVINGGYIEIDKCRVTVDSKSKGAVFSASGSLLIKNCEKVTVSAPDGSCSFYANDEVLIESSAIDLKSIYGMNTAPGGAVTMDGAAGSVSAVDGTAIDTSYVSLNSCDLSITAVGDGIRADQGGISLVESKLKIEAGGDGMDAEHQIELVDSNITVSTKMHAVRAKDCIAVENTVGTIAGTGDSGIGVCGGDALFELSEVTIKGKKMAVLAKQDGIQFTDNIYVKSPANTVVLKQEIDGQQRSVLANPDKSWVKEAVIARKRVSDPACTASIPAQTYTGTALKPPVTLKWKGTAMSQKTDYTVGSYKININAGTASVTVSGKGKYTGQADKTFTIKPASITAASIGAITEQTYTGTALKPAPVIKFNGKTLKKGTDYTLSYANNKEAGTAKVTVAGKGNFTGSKTCSFKITGKAKDDTAADKPKDDTTADKPKEDTADGKAEDGTAVGKGASLIVADKAITEMKKDEAPAGSTFGLLQLKAVSKKKTSVKISWKKVSGAEKYIVYGNACGTKNKMKKLKTTAKKSLTFKKVAGKKVKTNKYYKFLVVAVDQNSKVVSTSKTVHIAAKGNKYGNDKKVITAAAKKKNKITLKKGKTFKLKAKPVAASKKRKVRRHRGIAYETSDSGIATVSKKGVIKAKKKKGSCYIYAYAQNGVFAKIKVTVK